MFWIKILNNLIVFSDCKSILEGIRNNQLNIYKNYYGNYKSALHTQEDIWYEDYWNDVMKWVSSHVGIKDKEVADSLAKKAASEEEDKNLYVPIGDLRRVLNQKHENIYLGYNKKGGDV